MPRAGPIGEATSPPVAPTPPRDKDHGTKRKETLRTLLDALHELSKDDTGPDKVKGAFEDDRDVPTVDEHLQRVGAEQFYRFQRRVTNLDKELRNFSNAARQLGSSVGILSSAYRLRERLAHLLHLFNENAADLFPRKIQHHVKEPLLHPLAKPSRRMRKPPPNVALPAIDKDLDPEDFPNQFNLLAKDIMTLLGCLNEFPEFTDEAMNASIQSFEVDLKYWSSCLRTYKDQFRYPAVQRYLHDLTGEMGEQLDAITSSLAYFTEVGVPTIRLNQKHGAANLQNLSTVATFFSAVTATTLQFSYQLIETKTQAAVNAFWFASLVFSIASAVNSLLGVTWKQAMYRSPGHRVPWWVLIWIKRSPLVFLVISVASFSIGLVIFTYASQQDRITTIITTVFTGFSSFGLVAVSAWFASERWAYAHHKGQKWLADVIEDINNRALAIPPVRWCTAAGVGVARHGKRSIKRSNTALSQASLRAKEWASTVMGPRMSEEEESLPTSNPTRSFSPMVQSPIMTPGISETTANGLGERRPSSMGSPTSEKDAQLSSPNGAGQAETAMLSSPARNRFASLVRAAVLMRRSASVATPAMMLASPTRRRTHSSSHQDTIGAFGVKGSRLATLTPKLKSLEPTQDLAAHQALVRHLQFSPDGKYMATSSWDRTSVVFKVGEPFKQYRVLAHPQGFVGQVAWSPHDGLLMTKLGRGMKIWTRDGVCKKTIDRKRTVGSVTWLAKEEAFLSVEGCEVVKLDLNGKILDTYSFDRLHIHDVTVTEDAVRLLAVGTLLTSEDGRKPSKCRAEKRIVVYNMAEKEVENQVPVLNDVRDVTMSRDGTCALVSYENKAPPQLWKLDMLKDRESADPNDKNARLVLRHTYMPKSPVDFAGPSYFGGKDDQLVLCAGKAGDIHIWDRDSAALLHHVQAQASGGDLTCIAWNHAAEDPFMFATGSHDGAVRVWTTPPSPLRESHSFVIDVRAPSPGAASMVFNRNPSPVPSVSPATSGRTSPAGRPAQSLFAPDMTFKMDSPVSDTFGLSTADMSDVVRQAMLRSRPGSPERRGDRRSVSHSRPGSPERRDGNLDPSSSQRRVLFASPKGSLD